MLEVLLFLTSVSFLLIIGGFVLLLKQYKEIKNIITVLNAKQEEGKSAMGNSIPIKLDLGTLNNLIASGIAKNSNSSNNNQESEKNK
ncbi:hypothetical protein ACSYR0_02340 (plasmid) [Bacillus cereus]|uniref:hypothetical protein n=1 Tax=Bacillus cereus TaxID=1396 RepID=UPI0001A0E782|nr:hypothetical protein [Bacillus cereus]EEL61893.1 hypothetical protein bcere0025_53860 [Bacillus cereus F65185]EKS7870175.1 hypothetical protein [Bacillus cereus]PFI73660.1 hypothetical protein COI85_18175 [Bacillus cereus]PFJ60713.1 hypothetical protein COI94_29120 [Bacillus cereus]PFN40950.1 hypothetical protein COJ57_04710 [Bacillus cereus]